MAAPTTTEAQPPGKGQAPAEHQPYVPDKVRMPEFTWSAVLVGAILGIIFGASSLYLVLKVGLTVSASIPVAVLSITLFRVLSKLPFISRANILENNIVQTTGSAGESIAFGVGVTMPALMLLGFEMDIGRVMVVSILGGLLGILMMIPLRRAFIVKQHGTLKYPEGTACAEVLIVGEQGGTTAKTVFAGFSIAFVYQFLWQGFKFWKEVAARPLSWFKGATPAIEVNPALLGVGYIIGTKISCVMVAGGVLASFVLIPAIRLFGDGLQEPLYPGKIPISQMDEEQLWHDYVLYIGAGAVAAGGIISLFQALPLIVSSFRAGLRDILATREAGTNGEGVPRTDRDLPLWLVGVGSVFLVFAIWVTTPLHRRWPVVPDLQMNLLGALLIVLFGFLFVTVSSRLTGEIGSSSNPISGMTVATLLLTCLIFLALKWDHPEDRLTALSVAAVVCIAASNGGTTSQDLKTGYLVGGTPKWQQLAILVGALSSALVIGFILVRLNDAYTIYSTQDLPVLKKPLDLSPLDDQERAPNDNTLYRVWRAVEGNAEEVPPGKYLVNDQGQIAYLVDPGINGQRSRKDDGTPVIRFKAPKAVLMAFITDGILRGKLPWTLVLLGVSIAVVLELSGVPSLPFAVGVYLPLSSSTPIFAGGLVRYVVDRWNARGLAQARPETESDTSAGVLLSTGYIAGGTIAGVVIAFLSFPATESVMNLMGSWQFRSYRVAQEKPFKDVCEDVARRELGLEGKKSLRHKDQQEVEEMADQIQQLNKGELARYVAVPAGTVLRLPGQKFWAVKETTYLGDVARQVPELGSPDRAQLLLELNKVPVQYPGVIGFAPAAVFPGNLPWADLVQDEQKNPPAPAKTELPDTLLLPAGATLKIPQGNVLALIAFGVLVLILALVGVGWLLRSPPTPGIEPEDTGPLENGPLATADEMGISHPRS